MTFGHQLWSNVRHWRNARVLDSCGPGTRFHGIADKRGSQSRIEVGRDCLIEGRLVTEAPGSVVRIGSNVLVIADGKDACTHGRELCPVQQVSGSRLMSSLLQTAERLAISLLPPTVTRSLQQLKQRLPLRLPQSAPVVQMYLNDTHTRSFVGLHNFYSCLLPEVETAAKVQLRCYSPSGRLLVKHELGLPHFAARAVDIKGLFATQGINSPFGVVTVQITPQAPRRRIYRDLGQVSAHFFVFFRDDKIGSVEQTHPLSTTDPANHPSGPFCSSQILSTDKLRQLVAFQYNPGPNAHSLEHSLVDAETGETVARSNHAIPAMGSARSVFTMAELTRLPDRLLFCVDALPSANSNPMLRRVFDGGRHSMSHA